MADKDFAPGLPFKKEKTLPRFVVKPETWIVGVQEHSANRAGEHYDLRIADPEKGIAHSFAGKKWPEPGESTTYVHQPDHRPEYMSFSGEIESGYGAGQVKSKIISEAEILPSVSKVIKFNLYDQKIPEEFLLINTKGDNWILSNRTPSRLKKDLPNFKPTYKEKAISELSFEDKNEVFTPKYDGGHGILDLQKGRPIRAFSYIDAKNKTGLVDHTRKIPLFQEDIKSKLDKTQLRVELMGRDRDTGKAISANEIAGLLNSKVWKSREQQAMKNVELFPVAIGVHKFKGKEIPTSVSFNEIKKMLAEVSEAHPEIPIMEYAEAPIEKQHLLKRISDGNHPLTKEGIVAFTRDEKSVPIKAKLKKTFDAKITGFVAEKSKSGEEKDRVGKIEFNLQGQDGVVGTGKGLTHSLKKLIWNNPEKFIGKTMILNADSQLKSGKLRAPSYQGFHLDKNDPDFLEWLEKQSSEKRSQYSFLGFQFPKEIKDEIHEWSMKNIPKKDIFIEKGEDHTGRENDTHITVKYGIRSTNPKIIQSVADKIEPFKIKLGKISKFTKDDHDVLKIGIQKSPKLHALHETFLNETNNNESYPIYRPHVTLAYVKKGVADKFIGSSVFEGKEVDVKKLSFYDKKDKKTSIRLSDKRPLDAIKKIAMSTHWSRRNGPVETKSI